MCCNSWYVIKHLLDFTACNNEMLDFGDLQAIKGTLHSKLALGFF